MWNCKYILIKNEPSLSSLDQQSFEYTDLCQPIGLDSSAIPVPVNGLQRNSLSVHGSQNSPTASIGSNPTSTRSSRPWHDFGRQNDADKIQIPKMWVSHYTEYIRYFPINNKYYVAFCHWLDAVSGTNYKWPRLISLLCMAQLHNSILFFTYPKPESKKKY